MKTTRKKIIKISIISIVLVSLIIICILSVQIVPQNSIKEKEHNFMPTVKSYSETCAGMMEMFENDPTFQKGKLLVKFAETTEEAYKIYCFFAEHRNDFRPYIDKMAKQIRILMQISEDSLKSKIKKELKKGLTLDRIKVLMNYYYDEPIKTYLIVYAREKIETISQAKKFTSNLPSTRYSILLSSKNFSVEEKFDYSDLFVGIAVKFYPQIKTLEDAKYLYFLAKYTKRRILKKWNKIALEHASKVKTLEESIYFVDHTLVGSIGGDLAEDIQEGIVKKELNSISDPEKISVLMQIVQKDTKAYNLARKKLYELISK
jgi:hypothetical protein